MSVVGRLIGLAFSDYIFEDSLESEDWSGNATIDGEDVCEVDIRLQIFPVMTICLFYSTYMYLQRHYWVAMYVRHPTLGTC